ncbi:MAG: tetratricopeptide repeat protein [Thermodesulfobacteriota bacterium]|jgi:tetratricopeptide (TPR) repeat protein
MKKHGPIMNNDHGELKTLKEQYLMARKALSRVKSGTRQRELKEYFNDLKIELGWALLDHGKYEQGFALFESLSWRGDGEMKCNGMARALTEMGYYDEARKLLEVGLRRFPKSYALWVAKGALCDSLGDTFGLLECIEISLRFAPEDNSTGLYNKAFALIKLGCYSDALPIIDELIERYPDDPRHLAERGSCALEMGYPQEALQYYQKAMEVWKRSPTIYEGICVYSGLCSSYMELGMKTEAMEIALEGLKKFPDDDPALYQNVAATFFEMGWRKEVTEVLKKGVEKFPGDEDLKKFLKDVEDDMDDPDGGEEPPILGLILLMGLIRKKLKNFRK